MTDNGPAAMINVKQPGGALRPAVGNGSHNDTKAIQAIIDHANSINKHVFFPPGEYLVTDDILIKGSAELHGTQIGIAVIKASTPYANKIHNNQLPVRSVALNYLYFDVIQLLFKGSAKRSSTTSNITVDSCVFFSSRSPSMTPKALQNLGQLELRHLENSGVHKCVFLRDSNAFGVASKFSNTSGVQVTGNICGLDLSKMGWLSNQIEPVSPWQDQKQKLEFLRTHYNLTADQGFFKSCLYDQCDKQMVIAENIFNASPNTGNHKKDHAMYLKGFKVMFVQSNYVRGWPADASGGIKVRNGQHLDLARNYIDDTGIMLYTYNRSKQCLYDGFKDSLIYGNHIVQRTNPNNRTSGISYQEPLRTQGRRDENIVYSANVFEIVNVSNPTICRCIWLTNGNVSQHHVYEDNVYYGTSTKVKLQARNDTPSHQTGNIDPAIQNLYNYPPYQLNIPPY